MEYLRDHNCFKVILDRLQTHLSLNHKSGIADNVVRNQSSTKVSPDVKKEISSVVDFESNFITPDVDEHEANVVYDANIKCENVKIATYNKNEEPLCEKINTDVENIEESECSLEVSYKEGGSQIPLSAYQVLAKLMTIGESVLKI